MSEKNFLQQIKDGAARIIDDLGENFRDFTDFVVSLKELAVKRKNNKAMEFFSVVAHLGAVMRAAGVTKPEKASVLDLGQMYAPTLGVAQQKGQEVTR